MNDRITLMLVEDHPDYREGIALALETNEQIELTSKFGSAEHALRSIQNQCERSAPDTVLLDLNLPGMSGLDALPWFKKYSPKTKIIVLTQSDAEADVLCAIRLGAEGYLLKSASMQEIIQGIHTVMNGGATLDPSVAKFILNTLQPKLFAKKNSEQDLSKRERQILQLIADGLSKKEIAHRLNISTTTVITYVNRIYTKLNVLNAPSAISKAYKTGIFPSGE